jgi:hypothetical protein
MIEGVAGTRPRLSRKKTFRGEGYMRVRCEGFGGLSWLCTLKNTDDGRRREADKKAHEFLSQVIGNDAR